MCPILEIIIDASQLEVFEACPRKWFYSYPQNLVPRVSHRSFNIGSYYHEVLALFYSLQLGPSAYPELSNPAHNPSEHWKLWLRKLGQIVDFNTRVKCAVEFAAQDPLLKKFNIKLIDDQKFHRKRIVDYIYKWAHEDEPFKVVAVEQGFSWLLYEDESRRYILEGKIDFVGKGQPYGLFVMDHKTQSRFDDRFEFNHQVCNYLSFMEHCGTPANYFVYNYIGLQDKLPINGMRRMIYRPHDGMLQQWQKEVKGSFDQMANYIAYQKGIRFCNKCGYSGSEKQHSNCGYDSFVIQQPKSIDAFPRRRAACDSSKYGLCHYHKLCSVPDDSPFTIAVASAYKEKEERWRAWT